MIICEKTCGEEATSGGAARTLWRRVEWGPGPSRRGADGLAGEGRVLPARRRTRAATSLARGSMMCVTAHLCLLSCSRPIPMLGLRC